MSNVRVRYHKIGPDGVTKSRRIFKTAEGREVQVELNTLTKKFRVLDAVTSEEIMTGGTSTNLSVAKIQTKNALLFLGVDFTAEMRQRTDAE